MFLAPVTLTDPMTLPTNSTHNAWSYTKCANMNLLRQGFQKLSSDRQTYTHIYRQTDRIDQN